MKSPINVFILVFVGVLLGMLMLSTIFSLSFILARAILVSFGIALMALGLKIWRRRR